jgi:hypothetical protein
MGFSGNINQIGLTDLVQLLNIGQKTGTLLILTDRGRFTLAFRDGRIVDASAARHIAQSNGNSHATYQIQEARALVPENGNQEEQRTRLKEMASKIVRLSTGHFNFQPSSPEYASMPAAIALDVPSVLLNSFHEVDESARNGVAVVEYDNELGGENSDAAKELGSALALTDQRQSRPDPAGQLAWVHGAIETLPSDATEPHLYALLANYAATIFRRSALFHVRDGELQGIIANSAEAKREIAQRLHVAFSLLRIPEGHGGLLEASSKDFQPRFELLDRDWWTRFMPSEFGGTPEGEVVILPVSGGLAQASIVILGDQFIREDFAHDWQALQILIAFVNLRLENHRLRNQNGSWKLLPFPRRVAG